MTVMIGVDPHKGSHTAVAVDAGERSLAELRVRCGPKQLERLLKWAAQVPERAEAAALRCVRRGSRPTLRDATSSRAGSAPGGAAIP
jgi:hypothetical protein